jgi:hypothetical protein
MTTEYGENRCEYLNGLRYYIEIGKYHFGDFRSAVAAADKVLSDVIHMVVKGFWKVSFEPSRTEFSKDLEMGTSSTTADEFAEKRVRRLLLNENPMSGKSPKENFVGLANEMMSENLVQGLNSVVKIEHSPFLDLYPAFGHDPQSFIEIAWIAAVTDLKLSAAVEHIHHLPVNDLPVITN